MDFTSFSFIVIIGIFFIGYALVCYTFIQFNLTYIASSSLLIYALWSPSSFLILLYVISVCLIAVNYFQNRNSRKLWVLWIYVALLLLPLVSFKYTEFIQQSIGIIIIDASNWFLPLGISFYVFTSIALLLDVFNNKENKHIGLIEVVTLISYWPHLAAGPILRSSFITEHKNRLKFSKNYIKGTIFVAGGFAKKVFVADNLGAYVNHNLAKGISEMDGLTAILTIFGFGGQIYADFSGYSEMAIGFSILIGYQIPANFNYPYTARSITEFWHRWHISLSTWFRDYLYIPLGGNRKGPTRWIFNILLVFVISGLWHGASYSFLIWGAIHGVLIIIQKLSYRLYRPKFLYISWLLTFLLVNLAWSFFLLEVDDAIKIILIILDPSKWLEFNPNTFYYTIPILFFIVILFIDHWFKYYTVNDKGHVVVFDLRSKKTTFLYIWAMFTLALFFSGNTLPFIYFEF